ncbi:hypothetical protein SUGI_0552540 [Cryptomeria japonica]|nr:hypothetical protein SUGI_0552540 [Cryptomeria japonica]
MNKELFRALETGHVEAIKILHKQNSRVLLDATFQGDIPLHIAAREGHLPIVHWILQEKPSLAGTFNMDESTPLHEAVKNGNPDLVRILLQHKRSSAYHYNKFRETALIIASKYGHVETVELLWGAKEYNDASETQQSLRLAAYGGYSDVVKAIVGNPIKPRPLIFHCPLLVLLEKYADLTRAILEKAVKRRLLDVFRDEIENRGATPNLHAAVHGGHLEILEVMLDSPAWNKELMIEKDECGRCAIHIAAMKGSWNIINEFIRRWPDCVQIRSSDHKSVLHFAVEYNQFEIVRNLLINERPEKVAQLVSRDRDLSHNTALHLAVKDGVDPQLVEYLVSFAGIDVNALNDEDMTALDMASAPAAQHNPNCTVIVEKLEDAGAIRWSLVQKSNTISDPRNVSNQGGDTDIVNTHMVVASLIATVTFAAMFQIPGGIEDDKNSIQYGAAKMAFNKLFRFFIFSDTAAFATSFTGVVAWLIRQLFGDTYLGRRSALSHMSEVALVVSILWTMVAFVSATIIATIPANYQSLKSEQMEAFSKYQSLMLNEICFAIIPPLYVGMPLLTKFFRIHRVRIGFKGHWTFQFGLEVALFAMVLKEEKMFIVGILP